MKNFIQLLLIIISVSFSKEAKSQLLGEQLPPITHSSIASPNVASLGLFTEMPVSHFTGLPVIDLPVYEYKEGNISIPISLDYHASGFRPDVHPSWVGMNWNLTVGGVISRKVNDKADDYSINKPNPDIGDDPGDPYANLSGFYYHRSLLDANKWNNPAYLQELTLSNSDIVFNVGMEDKEPDEFSFSFPGGNGKFYMDIDGSWKVYSDKPVTITFDGKFLSVPFTPISGTHRYVYGYYKTFSGFTITDANGTKYVYGGSTDFIEYSTDFTFQDRYPWQADAWYLKEIIDIAGNKVSFSYGRGEYIAQLTSNLRKDYEYKNMSGGFWVSPCSTGESSLYQEFLGRLISPLYLEKIEGRLGRIEFKREPSIQELRLSQSYNYYYPTALRIYEKIWEDNFGALSPRNQGGYSIYTYNNWNAFQFLRQYVSLAPPIMRMNAPVDNSYKSEYALFCTGFMEWYRLKQIDIYTGKQNDLDSKKIKSFTFNYSSVPNIRLQLAGFKEEVDENNSLPGYKFQYNSMSDVPYFSSNVDHWGFFNNKAPNIPPRVQEATLKSDPQLYYSCRNPDNNYAQQGMLNKITYPTGGSTEFEYEGHKAALQVPKERYAALKKFSDEVGGIRIKKITHYDSPTSTPVTKEYLYIKNYNGIDDNTLVSSGVVGGEILYFFDAFEVKGSNMNVKRTLFSSLSHLPASYNSMGSHIGYSEVVEKIGDGSYTKFYYTNFDNGHQDEQSVTINPWLSPYGQYTSLENERGKLYKAEKFDKKNILKYRKETEYIALNKTTEFAKAIHAKRITICPNTNDHYADAKFYKLYTYSYLPSKETETLFENNQTSLVTTKTISYNKYKYPLEIVNATSKGELFNNKYTYPTNFTGTAIYDEMLKRNIIAPIIEQTTIKGATELSKTTTNYDFWNGTSIIAPNNIKKSILGNILETEVTYNQYDLYGNPLEYTTKEGITTTLIWGYKNTYPVAKIVGAGYNTAKQYINQNILDNPLNDQQIRDELNKLRINLSNTQILTYTYASLIGMTSETDPNGKTTYYEYDGFGRLQYIKDENKNILKRFCYSYNGQPIDCK